jgi:hypothetical protein
MQQAFTLAQGACYIRAYSPILIFSRQRVRSPTVSEGYLGNALVDSNRPNHEGSPR